MNLPTLFLDQTDVLTCLIITDALCFIQVPYLIFYLEDGVLVKLESKCRLELPDGKSCRFIIISNLITGLDIKEIVGSCN